ncbi:alpha/beta hydrolase [Sphaerisporangium sp. NPDC051011]|uniref:alpha/beta fold hydrolase n=1 Tax=Sphaerisporangium sp. NPDC051011 TaxID=3155792 RepID=UPI0033CC1572
MIDLTADDGTIETGRVEVSPGVELHYERRGGGPDLVLVNDFLMESSSWRPFTSRLQNECRLLSYDQRGQGESSRADAVWADHVADLATLLDALGVREAFLLGTSSAALLCRDFALAHPKRTRGLILAGPALSPFGGRRHRRIVTSWIRTLDGQGLPALFDQLYPLVSGDYGAEVAGTTGFLGRKQAFLALHTPETIRAGMAASLMADHDPVLLAGVRCPVLVVAGDDDFILGVAAAERLAELIPRGRAVVFPRTGHLPFVEQPHRFQEEAAAFVAEVVKGGRDGD